MIFRKRKYISVQFCSWAATVFEMEQQEDEEIDER